MRYSLLFFAMMFLPVGFGLSQAIAAEEGNLCFQATLETKGDKAIAVCTRAIASGLKGRNLANAYSNRGLGYMKNKDYDRAIKDFDESVRIDPKYPFAYDNRGDARRYKGQLDLAIADYNEAIRVDPTFGSAYLNRGITYERMGNQVSARADYRTALALKGTRPIDKWAREEAQGRLKKLDAKR